RSMPARAPKAQVPPRKAELSFSRAGIKPAPTSGRDFTVTCHSRLRKPKLGHVTTAKPKRLWLRPEDPSPTRRRVAQPLTTRLIDEATRMLHFDLCQPSGGRV